MKRVLFLLCILSWIKVYSQSNAPKYSNEFLAIGVDARSFGMGNAFTAVSNDASSGYWNPAGLNKIQNDFDLGFMHAEYFAGIANYDYLGFATRIDSLSTFGITAIRFGIDDIPDTRFLYDANGALNYDNIKFFSAVDYAFLFTYARILPYFGGIEIGGNVKIIHRSAGQFAKAWGYGIDLGAQKSIGNLNIGLMLRDITGTYNAWYHNTELVADIYTQTGNEIPENSIEITLPRAILGVSYYYSFKSIVGVLVAFDLENTFDGPRNTIIKAEFASMDPRFGLELDYRQKFYVRGGVSQFQKIQNFDRSYNTVFQPNFGLGIKLQMKKENTFKIDYALTDLGNQAETPYSHVVSLKLSFDVE
ncbi:putative type IX sorting system protein PorV2 [Reichenbachiella versicolor]